MRDFVSAASGAFEMLSEENQNGATPPSGRHRI
jgi:hypothetical protein